MNNRIIFCVVVVAVIFTLSPQILWAQTTDRDALRQRVEWLKSTPNATIDGAPIAARSLIPALYERRGYEPAWTPEMVKQLFEQVLRSVEHGLNPDDYHAALLGARLDPGSRASDPIFRADTEILCTEALARLAVTLKFGKLNPADLDSAWNFSRKIENRDPVQVLNDALESGNIAAALDNQAPDLRAYNLLRNSLIRYRGILAQGGWPAVPAGPVLKPEMTSPRVATLRQRLLISGDLEASGSGDPAAFTEVFDERLEAAVKRFQIRHGLDADGKVGPRSIEELNVPVETRIGQIRATLERVRWVFRDVPEDFLIADIAGFELFLYRQKEIVWRTRIQVGKPYHATPVFKDMVQYLDFNPTWTIPPGILRKETLPAIRRDPNYLSRNNMSVVTMSGTIVDPATIDWAATANKGFPYMIRQEPGPHNALGRVKFMFPNQYMVYLHDTPSKGLFARAERAFSHGCIRTQNPFDLAELLLADQGWDRARIDKVVASKKNTRVNLENPIPVMLLYWTAQADAEGTVFFRKDVYNRDAPIVEGLDEPFLVSLPAGLEEAIEGR